LSAGLFHMKLSNYVAFGTYQTQLLNIRTGTFDTYNISAPVNSSGSIKGVELAWQQPLPYGFGLNANYTYADASETGGQDLVGASKNTYNLGAYYENHGFGARLNYTYRSAFFVGLDRSTPQYQDDTATLAASLSYTFNKNFSINFDALNLNDPILTYYGANRDQPRAFYANGRQYYLSVRFKL
jgi:iron complex outermembrane recepter protein